MLSQDDFDKFVESFNEDYILLLQRAAGGAYECLITSFTVLKDLQDILVKLHDMSGYRFRVIPHPLTFRANDELLRSFGFDDEEIGNIYGFLRYVRQSQGKDFEECIQEGITPACARAAV